MLADVLRGSSSKKLLSAELNLVVEYGKLVAIKREDIIVIIEWLIANKYILQTKGPYPVLHPTYEGTHYSDTITPGKLKKLLEELNKQLK